MAALLERAVKAVHKDKADQLMPVLGKAFAARIGEGVQSGFAKNPFEVAWNTPDGEMIRHLQANVYEFSFAKSYQQLRALTQALYGKDGHIIPFHEFREVAIRINNEVAVRHLETEYNTAIASAQMASRWVQFEADKKEFPLLTYQTVGDGSVRPSHAALDGVTRPVEDPFWSEYYPPNGWGCRCDVIQAIGRRATPAEKIAIPEDVPALFKTNTAKGGLVFPEGHPTLSSCRQRSRRRPAAAIPLLMKKHT
jgi:SPP1 gp7 family putative phage head morphogenesis protein